MSNPIKQAIKGGHGTGILYAGMIGLALSDAIPTPADAVIGVIGKNIKADTRIQKELLAAKNGTP